MVISLSVEILWLKFSRSCSPYCALCLTSKSHVISRDVILTTRVASSSVAEATSRQLVSALVISSSSSGEHEPESGDHQQSAVVILSLLMTNTLEFASETCVQTRHLMCFFNFKLLRFVSRERTFCSSKCNVWVYVS